MWQFGPVLRSLLRNRFAMIVMIVQLTIATIILANLLYMIALLVELRDAPLGIDPSTQFSLLIRPTQKPANYAQAQQDFAAIAQVPGVASVSAVRWAPFLGQAVASELRKDAEADSFSVKAQSVDVSHEALTTLTLPLIAGRNFTPDDMVSRQGLSGSQPKVAIITQKLSRELAGEEGSALGKVYYLYRTPIEIIGITQDWLGFTRQGISNNENTLFLPGYDENDTEHRYLIRANSPQALKQVIEAVNEQLEKEYQGQVFLYVNSLPDVIDFINLGTTRTQNLFVVMFGFLVLILALAIGGQTYYWACQRRKSIGIRRALGATSGDIVRWFALENALLSVFAVLLGASVTLLINQMLISVLQGGGDLILQPLSPVTLVLLCLSLVMICQLCAFIPARSSAKISPNMATRSI